MVAGRKMSYWRVAELYIWIHGQLGQRDTGPGLSFGNLKSSLQWHTSSNKAAPTLIRSYPLIVPLPMDQTFKHESTGGIPIQTTTSEEVTDCKPLCSDLLAVVWPLRCLLPSPSLVASALTWSLNQPYCTMSHLSQETMSPQKRRLTKALIKIDLGWG